MKSRSVILASLFALIFPSICWSLPPHGLAELAGTIDQVTPALMAQHKTPGVSIALIDSCRISWCQSYGVKRADAADRVTEDTVFEACSMSKPLFAYAVLKLVEAQRLDLERPLVDYLGRSYLKDTPLHRKITAKMVLTHTTGFPNWRKGGWRAAGPLPVRFEPGTKFGYSGEGFWYLQQVVEHILNEPLEPWIQRSLMQPLRMTHSSFIWQPNYKSLAAEGHTVTGEVKVDRNVFDQANAAFSLYTTPTDYARFLIEIMTGARCQAPHSLSQETIQAMLKPTVKSDRGAKVWRGLGWAITQSDAGSFAWHSGANGTGFRCYCRFDQTAGRGMVIMTNAIGGAKVWDGIVQAISR